MKGVNYFLRRIDSDVLDKKFIAALNKCSERYNSIKTNYPQSLTWFRNFVTATLIISLERMASLEDENYTYKIQESLADYYSDEIEERWNELQEFGIRESITRILREETEEYKVNLVKKIIYTLYDNISFIEQSTYYGRPLLIIYFESNDTAANIESWFDEKISRDVREWTSENIVVCPNWAANWDSRKKNADVFINTELLKYDNLGNVVNESVLREEMRPYKIMRRTHLIDHEITRLLDKVYKGKKICELYDDEDMFVRVATEAVVENLYFNTFYMMDDTSLEWEKSVDFIYDYIKDSYGKVLTDYYNKVCRRKFETNESDPKVGTGKKPKGSDRRLYTDENPNDTVAVKFRTKEDIADTLNKESFKSKSHKRQSQIINLIHQRVRAAYQNAKDPETKDRLKRAYDYIENKKEQSKQKTIRLQKQEQNEVRDKKIVCNECGWSWKLSEGGNDPYTCHKCGNENHKSELTEKCWPGYTQKGMKTMFGKRYPNCVKKTKK